MLVPFVIVSIGYGHFKGVKAPYLQVFCHHKGAGRSEMSFRLLFYIYFMFPGMSSKDGRVPPVRAPLSRPKPGRPHTVWGYRTYYVFSHNTHFLYILIQSPFSFYILILLHFLYIF